MTRTPQQTNDWLRSLIQRVKIDQAYTYRADDLLDEKIQFLAAHCEKVLDIGRSSRERYGLFKKDQARTLDINQFSDYPDIVDDLCNIQHVAPESFDGIVCMAVLEHVYAPHSAIDNLHRMLKPGGYGLLYGPFLYRYHGPTDLTYQDFFRYTRDGLAYLLRDFSEVTLYPCLGRVSTAFHLFAFWKEYSHKLFGQSLNKLVDRIGGLLMAADHSELQASGYYVWVVK